MHRFMIGQYGRFDYNKFQRDFRKGFHGIEACLLAEEEDIQALIREAENHAFRIGIHFPLRAGQSKLRDALFMALDNKVRNDAFAYVEKELEAAARVRPEYILFHYPKPVILDDRVNWQQWRFTDVSEYAYESSFPHEQFVERSEYVFAWLAGKGKEYGFTPVLEFDALNRYVYESNVTEELLRRYDNIKLCLDTGRFYLQEKLDLYFDAKQVLRTYAKYAETVHLWNVQIVGETIRNNHYPALPGLKPADGWAPIEEYLRIIARENPAVKIMFEHRSDAVSDEELEACYQWVKTII